MKTHLAAVCTISAFLALASFGVVRGAEPADGKGTVQMQLLGDQGTPWKIPDGTTKLTVLAVGGGGSGAPGLGNAGGGGGAGGLVFVDDYLTKFNAKPGLVVQVKVGIPGAIQNLNQARRGFPGTDTVFGKIRAIGGGGGGRGRDTDPAHHASSGGSAGGGTMFDNLPEALQPAESGVGIGFGHPGGGVPGPAAEGRGANGGGAGAPGTAIGEGGAGGIGLQGVPKSEYIDPQTGFVTKDFNAENAAHYRVLFRDVFGPGIGEDGWFAGGGANNSSQRLDKGGRGGGSTYDGLPHTGGGGGGSTHGYRGSDPGVGGTGVVLVRCQFADGKVQVYAWGHTQPDEFISRRILKDSRLLFESGKYTQALEELAKQDVNELPQSVQVEMLRIYGRIHAAMGNEEESLATFKQALDLENN